MYIFLFVLWICTFDPLTSFAWAAQEEWFHGWFFGWWSIWRQRRHLLCFACLLIEIFSSCSEISYDFVAIAFNWPFWALTVEKVVRVSTHCLHCIHICLFVYMSAGNGDSVSQGVNQHLTHLDGSLISGRLQLLSPPLVPFMLERTIQTPVPKIHRSDIKQVLAVQSGSFWGRVWEVMRSLLLVRRATNICLGF